MHKPVQVVSTRVVAQKADPSQRQYVSLLIRIPLVRWLEGTGSSRERADSSVRVTAKMEPRAAVRGLDPELGNPFSLLCVLCFALCVLTWWAKDLQPEVEAAEVSGEPGAGREEAESCADLRGLHGKGTAGAWEVHPVVHTCTHLSFGYFRCA